jgi:hypothetical protein
MVSFIVPPASPPRTLIGQPIIGCYSRSKYQKAQSSRYPPPSYDNRRVRASSRREMPVERIPAYVTGYSSRYNDDYYPPSYNSYNSYSDYNGHSSYNDYNSYDTYRTSTYGTHGYRDKSRLKSFGERVRRSPRRDLMDLMEYCLDDDDEISECTKYRCRYLY